MAGGRQKEPVDLLLFKGKKHLTKEEIEERRKNEITVESKPIAIPRGLTPFQKKLFKQKMIDLQEYNLFTHMEVGLLTRYVKETEEYNKVSEKLESNDPEFEVGTPNYTFLIKLKMNLSTSLLTLEKELGLTLFSRLKMAPPKKEEENKEIDNFTRAFK